jgi:hypothetical protein
MSVRYTSQGSTDAKNRVTFLVLSFAHQAWCRSTEGSTSARAKRKDAASAGQSSGPVRYASSLSKHIQPWIQLTFAFTEFWILF